MRYADSEQNRQRIIHGVRCNWDPRQLFLNGLYHEVFSEQSNDQELFSRAS